MKNIGYIGLLLMVAAALPAEARGRHGGSHRNAHRQAQRETDSRNSSGRNSSGHAHPGPGASHRVPGASHRVPGASHSRGHRGKGSLRVMSRNLYVGVDVFEILAAGQDPDPLAVPRAVAAALQQVEQTNFPERALAIAAEVERTRPHVIGLQEVPIYRIQSPGDVLVGNPEVASSVSIDFLQVLQQALVARGLNYQVAAETVEADLELPLLAGIAEDGATPLFDDLRFTDRDVLLVRGDLEFTDPLSGNFSANVQTTIGPFSFEFTRGFNMASVDWHGQSYRIVNTHLELGGEEPLISLQAAQMSELLAVVKATTEAELPVVLVGDLNSPPTDAAFTSTSGIPGLDGLDWEPPYLQALTAGYLDAWLGRPRETEGFTCCFDAALADETAELFERIDHVLVLPPEGRSVSVSSRLVGEQLSDRTASGLAPSDHAGVIARIRLHKQCHHGGSSHRKHSR